MRYMEPSSKPLYVRLPLAEADLLDGVAASTGISKKQLVSDAVRRHLEDEGLQVGRIALRESSAAEVMTLPEIALLLRLGEAQVRESAERGELPARWVGGEWRFSRAAVIAWLGGPPPAAVCTCG